MNPYGPLINRLKYFRIQFRFCRDIQILKKLLSVHPIPRSLPPQFASYRGVRLRRVHHTTESSSAVCIKPRSQSSVYFNPKFYQCYFSVMPKDINMKLFKESFLLKTFFDKTKLKVVASTKTRKTDIFESV